ncbi:hypothetical protein [Rhodanobacter sp. C05]|uniref:hypothetical protein n=1 Tax=Rhodanobacter sp. C05 TaxID=1945855 RepID=UPI00143ABFB4|nr:hypothetical protein [Rhodanobacter sp. C05]
MHHAFGDALAMEVHVFFEQRDILQWQRAAQAGGEAVLIVGHRCAGIGGQGLAIMAHGGLPGRRGFAPATSLAALMEFDDVDTSDSQ